MPSEFLGDDLVILFFDLYAVGAVGGGGGRRGSFKLGLFVFVGFRVGGKRGVEECWRGGVDALSMATD